MNRFPRKFIHDGGGGDSMPSRVSGGAPSVVPTPVSSGSASVGTHDSFEERNSAAVETSSARGGGSSSGGSGEVSAHRRSASENSDSAKSGASSSSRGKSRGGGGSGGGGSSHHRSLPVLFVLIEQNRWSRVADRARRHPREAAAWATVRKGGSSSGGGGGGGGSRPSTPGGSLVPDETKMSASDLPLSASSSSSSAPLGALPPHLLPLMPSSTPVSPAASSSSSSSSSTSVRCKALHHACHRLRSVSSKPWLPLTGGGGGGGLLSPIKGEGRGGLVDLDASQDSIDSGGSGTAAEAESASSPARSPGKSPGLMGHRLAAAAKQKQQHHQQNPGDDDDPFVEACLAILALLEAHPEAAGQRESRHGCLPLHLAAFGTCPAPMTAFLACAAGDGSAAAAEGIGLLEAAHQPRALATAPNFLARGKNFSFDGAGRGQQGRHQLPPHPQTRGSAGGGDIGGKPPIHVAQEANSSFGGMTVMIEAEMVLGFVEDNEEKHPLHSSSTLGGRGGSADNRPQGASDWGPKIRDSFLHVKKGPSADAPFATGGGTATLVPPPRLRPPPSSGRPVSLLSVDRSNSAPENNAAAASSKSSSSADLDDLAAGPGAVAAAAAAVAAMVDGCMLSEAKVKVLAAKVLARRERHAVRVVEALLDAYPRAARTDSEGGRLPLHTACAGGASPGVVAALLRAYPDAARQRNKDGYLPLHLAAHWGVSRPDVAPLLLTTYPDAVVGRNRWERTPLEEALVMAGENGRPYQVDLIRALRRHPTFWEAVASSQGQMRRGGGYHGSFGSGTGAVAGLSMETLLAPPSTSSGGGGGGGGGGIQSLARPEQPRERTHNLVDVDASLPDDMTSDDEEEDQRLGARRKASGQKGGNDITARGRTASASGEPLLGETLLGDSGGNGGGGGGAGFFRISPRHMLRKSSNGPPSKPRHRRSHTTTSVSHASSSSGGTGESSPPRMNGGEKYLAVAALAETTNLLNLIQSGAWPAVMARCESHPSEAKEMITTTVRGGYNARVSPLHLACERGPPLDSVEAVIEAWPKAVAQRKTPGGQLPLHALCTWGGTTDVVGFLLAANPCAAKVRDDLGNLPLHCACFSGADEVIVESLLCTFPNAVWARNGQGSAPADITRRLRHPNRRAVLDLIERHSLDMVKSQKIGPGGFPDHSLVLSSVGVSVNVAAQSHPAQDGHHDGFDDKNGDTGRAHEANAKKEDIKTEAKKKAKEEIEEADGLLWI